MKSNLVPTEQLLEQGQTVLVELADMMGSPAVVALVSTDFVPADSATWPAADASFPLLTSPAAWELQHDGVSEKDFFVATDPAGGWDFESTAAGASIIGFIVRGTTAANRVFANKFATPIPNPAAGTHIVLPYVAVEASQIVVPGESPYVLE